MPIPNAALAVIPPEKVTDYLLNLSHPVGGPKARWFLSLGYRPNRPERLAADLLEVVSHGEAFSTQISPFGVKYTVRGRMVTPSGHSVDVVTVWIAEPNVPYPQLVTAYPGKETSDEGT
jgi:hypothetical protein